MKPIKVMSAQDEQLARDAAIRLQQKEERKQQVERLMGESWKSKEYVPGDQVPYAKQQAYYWLIGIDGTMTPDPRYWFDRWEVVGPYIFPGQAITAWCKRREGWLDPSEIDLVRIWERKEEFFSDQAWLRENVQWGPDKYKAKILVNPWVDRK